MKLWSRRIYSDAAGATPLSKSARAELVRLLDFFGNPSALHEEGMLAKKELERAREVAAQTIGAHADEIIFTSGGTEANNLAIFGILRPLLHEHAKVHAITSAIEHSSVLEPLRALKEEGLELTELRVNENGIVSPKDLKEAIQENTVFVSIQMINSEIGTIQDIRELAKEVRHVRKHTAPARALRAARPSPTLAPSSVLPLHFHTDASQAPLWLPINVEKLGIDLLTLDAQKIMGPKGVGLLFVRRGTALTPLIYGGGQERGKRSGTENVPLIGSFAVALKEASEGVEARAKKVSKVRDYLIEEIKKALPNVFLNGAAGEWRSPNNINITIPNLNGDMAVIALNREGVAVSTRSACDTEDESPSHVLSAIGLSPEQAKNSIRITLLPDASIDDAKQIVKTLAEIAARY